MKNLYDILQVSENASDEIIEKAYKTLAKKYHPDLQPKEKKQTAEAMMKTINEAYEILSDPKKKEEYDKQRQEEKRAEEERKAAEMQRQQQAYYREYNEQQNSRQNEYADIQYQEMTQEEQGQEQQGMQDENLVRIYGKYAERNFF